MNNTILRFLIMLRMLPRAPRKIDTATMERKLRDEGYAVTRRTIQRDLHQLARTFPLLCDEHRPAGWSWAPDAALIDLPGMDPNTALTFILAERFLASLLPRSTFGRIRPYLTQAQRILDALPMNALGRWPSKVRVIHRGPPLRPPEIDEAILDVVTRGLLESRRLDVVYRSREKGELLRCELNPLGLVFKGGSAYLVCTFWDYTDIRQIVLHRVQRAEVIEVPAIVPGGRADSPRGGVQPWRGFPPPRHAVERGSGAHGAGPRARAPARHRREHGGAALVALGLCGAGGGARPCRPPG
jgi:predicted DNA-binding transcriptional regulator YafY